MIEELQARQKILFNLLMKKDVEINEYKMEGAQLSRSQFIYFYYLSLFTK